MLFSPGARLLDARIVALLLAAVELSHGSLPLVQAHLPDGEEGGQHGALAEGGNRHTGSSTRASLDARVLVSQLAGALSSSFHALARTKNNSTHETQQAKPLQKPQQGPSRAERLAMQERQLLAKR